MVGLLALSPCVYSQNIKGEVDVTNKQGQTITGSWEEPEEGLDESIILRAQDYVEAFHFLRQQNPTGKVFFIVSGVSIDRVEDFKIMSNGTLGVLYIRTNRGLQSKIIKIEDIDELGMR